MKRFLNFVLSTSRSVGLIVLLISGTAGLLSAAVIAVVGDLFSRIQEGVALGPLLLLVVLVITLTLMEYLAKRVLVRHSEGVAHRMRLDYVRWQLSQPVAKTEARGPTSLIATFSEDVRRITLALEYIPELGISLAAILGGAFYLVFVSWPVMAIAVVAIAPAAWVFMKIQGRVKTAVVEMLAHRDTSNRYFRALIQGVKEVSLDGDRRRRITQDYLSPESQQLSSASVRLAMGYTTGSLWTQFCYFTAIIAVLALVATNAAPVDIVAPYILVALFLKSYIFRFMHALPHWTAAGTVLERLDREGYQFPASDEPLDIAAERTQTPRPHIQVRDVKYRYISERDTTLFTAGPFDLELKNPEIIFITGHNGAGKSTFLKTLCGLYPPNEGNILLNGDVVDDSNRENYRSLFSAVFTVPNVFQEFPLELPQDEERKALFTSYMDVLQLDGKIDPERTSEMPELSHGQIKRYALLQALLDKRPIIMFDEWAENQDPAFKQVFYYDILPRLRDTGKVVVAVTHESHYFDAADRVYSLSSRTETAAATAEH